MTASADSSSAFGFVAGANARIDPDDVPDEVKRRRNNELLALQNQISEEDNQPFLGRTVEVLVEGPSKTSLRKHEDGPTLQLTGRTPCDRIVVFEGTERQIGQLLPVTIYEVLGRRRDQRVSK